MGLLDKLLNLKAMSPAAHKRVAALCARPDFQPDVIKCASLAAYGVCKFIHALVAHGAVVLQEAPKRERLALAQRRLKAVLDFEEEQKREVRVKQLSEKDVPSDMVRAQAAWAKGLDALADLSRKDICEVRAFGKPSKSVVLVA